MDIHCYMAENGALVSIDGKDPVDMATAALSLVQSGFSEAETIDIVNTLNDLTVDAECRMRVSPS